MTAGEPPGIPYAPAIRGATADVMTGYAIVQTTPAVAAILAYAR